MSSTPKYTSSSSTSESPRHNHPTFLASNLASKHSNKGNPTSSYSAAKKPELILTITTLVTLVLWLIYNKTNVLGQWKLGITSPSPTTLSATVLDVFQVYPRAFVGPRSFPDAFPEKPSDDGLHGGKPSSNDCSLLLMDHSFGFSYGKPFVGNYIPPKCKFNRVTMNFTAVSKGRQFDRLAIMYFNDTEIWRTSTAEPTFNGIRWEYVKDMSEFMYFWNSPQAIIFDLGNLISDVYTGAFNTTLTATFTQVEEAYNPADAIIPISARKGSESKASVFMLPNDEAINTIVLPRNINRAKFSVSACGQASEEFWWQNALQSDVDTFKDGMGTLDGFSPFREVQILIDGSIAGVQWPFPVIFTGGVVPGLWRPIVGIDTFDLREHEIDITPWLYILCDGEPHTFEIRVAGINDDGECHGTLTKTVGNSWYVTGKIFLWLDENANSITTGSPASDFSKPPSVLLSSTKTRNDKTGAVETLEYTTNVTRHIDILAKITTQKGTSLYRWHQDLSVTNLNIFTNFGATQESRHNTAGKDRIGTDRSSYTTEYNYPLYANTTFAVERTSGNFSLDATLEQGLDLAISSSYPHNFYQSVLATTLQGTAHYFGSPSAKMSTGYGSTNQSFSYTEKEKEKDRSSSQLEHTRNYSRDVEAVNGTLLRDVEDINGIAVVKDKTILEGWLSLAKAGAGSDGAGSMIIMSPREAIGRGPGKAKEVLISTGQEE